MTLNGPNYVGSVLPVPTGPVVTIDAGEIPDALLATIPDLIVRRLEEAGITDAVVSEPPQSDVPAFHEARRAVFLRLFPPPPVTERYQRQSASIPDRWLHEAVAWVRAGAADDELWAATVGQRFPLRPDAARGFLNQARRLGLSSATLAVGDPAERLRTEPAVPNSALSVLSATSCSTPSPTRS